MLTDIVLQTTTPTRQILCPKRLVLTTYFFAGHYTCFRCRLVSSSTRSSRGPSSIFAPPESTLQPYATKPHAREMLVRTRPLAIDLLHFSEVTMLQPHPIERRGGKTSLTATRSFPRTQVYLGVLPALNQHHLQHPVSNSQHHR